MSENTSRESVTSGPSIGQEGGQQGGQQGGRHGERLAVLWFVRITLWLCALISAEPGYGRRRRSSSVRGRPRARKSSAWAISFRSRFS